MTPQRLAIIKALLASAEHPRADAIYARVRKEHPHISLATVHRTLETLCDIGEARKVTMLHDSARYDGNVMPHHHVVCVKCRRIRDIEIPELDLVSVSIPGSPIWTLRFRRTPLSGSSGSPSRPLTN